jgi:crossover junction endodeoxyribonuclease RusA
MTDLNDAPTWTATRTATSTVLAFPQPGRLLNANHRHHWRARAQITRQWRTAARYAALILGTPSNRAHGKSFVRLIIPVPDRRRRDPGNLYPITKAAVDGCVDAGVWPDDTPEWVETLEPHLVYIPVPKGFVPTVELVIVPHRKDLTP